MLELAPPYAPARLSAVDTRRLWRCDEASASSSVTDSAPVTETLPVTGNPGVGPSLFAGGATGARTFNGATQWAADPSSGVDQAFLTAGNWQLEAWVRVDALGVIHTVAEYGHIAGSSTQAVLASLQVLDDGAVRFTWMDSALDSYAVTSDAGLFAAGDVHHLAVMVAVNASGSTWDVSLVVDGVVVAEVGNEIPASGGTAARWYLGASPSAGSLAAPGNLLQGALDDVRLSAFTSIAAIRETFARARRSWDLWSLIERRTYTVHRFLILEDSDGNDIDVTDHFGRNWLKGAELSQGVDDQTWSLRAQLHRNSYDANIAPLVEDSPVNIDAGGALLGLMRRVRLEVAIVPQGMPRSLVGFDRHVLFDGFSRRISWPDEEVALEALGKMRALQITWVRPAGVGEDEDHVFGATGGRALQLVVQDILDACEPAGGYVGGKPTLRVVDDPAFNIAPEYLLPPTRSVAQAIDDLVTETTGWWVRDWWDEHRQEWRLSLVEPPRGATWTSNDALIDPSSTLDVGKMDLDDEAVRNAVEVEVTDRAATDRTGTEVRATVYAEDAASIAAFGERYCRLSLESGSQLNDTAQAAVLRDHVLHDLRLPLVATTRRLPFRWHHELGDIVRVQPDGRRDDAARDYGTVGIRHRFTATEAWTELDLRQEAPAGRVWRWWDYIAQDGAVPGRGLTPVDQPSGLFAEAAANGIRIGWDLPVNSRARRYRETEIHVSASSGFTPSSSTLVGLVRGLSSTTIDATAIPPGQTRYVKVAHRDDMGNVSLVSSQVSGVARQTTVKGWASATRATTDQTLANGSAFQTVIFNSESADPLGRYNTGTGVFTALAAGLVAVSAQVLYDTATKPGSVAVLGIFNGASQVFEGAAVITAGTPDRGTPRVSATIRVAAGDTITVRISGTGNSGHEVVFGATTWATFDQVAED